MDIEGLRQIFRFEVSRYAYTDEERKLKLRKAYRQIEATLRETVRQLQLGGGGGYIPYGPLAEVLAQSARQLAGELDRYRSALSPEMARALAKLSAQLSQAQQQVSAHSDSLAEQLPQWAEELEGLKRALGEIHRL